MIDLRRRIAFALVLALVAQGIAGASMPGMHRAVPSDPSRTVAVQTHAMHAMHDMDGMASMHHGAAAQHADATRDCCGHGTCCATDHCPMQAAALVASIAVLQAIVRPATPTERIAAPSLSDRPPELLRPPIVSRA